MTETMLHSPAAPTERRRVGFLQTHPIQYVAPLLAYLNESADIEPVAIYLTDFSLRGAVDRQFGQAVNWDIDLLQGYEHHFVGANWKEAEPYGFFGLATPHVANAIRKLNLDALVIHGHNHAANLIAVAAARMLGVPVFYKAETHLELPRGGFKSALRPLALRALFSQIAGFLAIGSKNAAFYRSLGIGSDRIFSYPYTVDNARFTAQSKLAPAERAAERERLGLRPESVVVLYASKLMQRKHPDDLLASCQKLAAEGLQVELLFAGTGELMESLRSAAADNPALRVHFAGFVNQQQMPRLFAASDIFALPSENEPWGLIVNEAMCAGLPIVVSQEVGCVGDLVLAGDNGATFQAGSVDGLADALRPLLSDEGVRARMGLRSREIMETWSFAQNLAGLRAALGANVKRA